MKDACSTPIWCDCLVPRRTLSLRGLSSEEVPTRNAQTRLGVTRVLHLSGRKNEASRLHPYEPVSFHQRRVRCRIDAQAGPYRNSRVTEWNEPNDASYIAVGDRLEDLSGQCA